MSMATLVTLEIGGPPGPWRDLGLTLHDDGIIAFGNGALRLVDAPPGIAGWTLAGVPAGLTHVDGLPTRGGAGGARPAVEHPLGAFALDHVVVLSSCLERTCDAVATATGAPLKRVREAGPMRQGFHRLGPGGVILEVVERPELTGDSATFWGFVLNVHDLDAAAERLGPARVGRIKDAVQPGRRIATVRPEVGLGLAVALMSPPG